MTERERTQAGEGGPCVFCRIVAGDSPAEWVYTGSLVVAFRPLNPVTDGHVLVVPRMHVEDYTQEPMVTGLTAHVAAILGAHFQSNLITSAGPLATQTVRHLHFHIVPRREGDGLALPWTPPESTTRAVDQREE